MFKKPGTASAAAIFVLVLFTIPITYAIVKALPQAAENPAEKTEKKADDKKQHTVVALTTHSRRKGYMGIVSMRTTEGRISEIKVEVGDTVKKDQPLIDLVFLRRKADAQRFRVGAQWLQHKIEEINRDYADYVRDQTTRIAKGGAVAELERTEKVLKAKRKDMEVKLSDMLAKATDKESAPPSPETPIGGIVVEINAVQGQAANFYDMVDVELQTPPIRIVNTSILEVHMYVSFEESLSLAIGQEVTLRYTDRQGTITLPGKVVRDEHVENKKDMHINVNVHIEFHNPGLRVGYGRRIEILCPKK